MAEEKITAEQILKSKMQLVADRNERFATIMKTIHTMDEEIKRLSKREFDNIDRHQ